MKKNYTILVFLIAFLFFGCGNDEKKQPKKKVYPVNSLKTAPLKEISSASSKTIVQKEILTDSLSSRKNIFAVKKPIKINKRTQESKTLISTAASEPKKDPTENKLLSFTNLHKILSNCKIGQTLTQKELTQNFEIQKEAVKLVKSVTKTAQNEIEVKWHSTWFIEKISDAKLQDGRLKVVFKENKLYTSGNAIGIKYNKKIYNNLVIIGRSAYIPTVKGYSWQIGK